MSSLDHHHRFRRRSFSVISFSTLDLFWSFFTSWCPLHCYSLIGVGYILHCIINCHFTSKCVIYVQLIIKEALIWREYGKCSVETMGRLKSIYFAKDFLSSFSYAVPFLTTQSTLLLRFLNMAFMLILADLQIFLSSAYAPVVWVIRTRKPRMFFWDDFTS